LHNQINGADELLTDGARRQSHVAHLHHVLDAGDSIVSRVGMDRGHAA
jgi:hypothetical protein